jgi:cytochrome c
LWTIRRALLLLGVLLAAPAPWAAEGGRATEPVEDGIGLLATGRGAAETHAACTACHSERIVIQQGLPRQQWDELLDWMVDEHGMAPLRGRLRDTVLDYLSRQYGRDRPNYPPR